MLTERGLEAALTALAQRAPLPVDLSVALSDRLDPTIEAAAYFLVSEALTNVAKHARADRVSVELAATGGALEVTIADDGAGGADTAKGSGLRGLADRVSAIGGRLEVSSPPNWNSSKAGCNVIGAANIPVQPMPRLCNGLQSIFPRYLTLLRVIRRLNWIAALLVRPKRHWHA